MPTKGERADWSFDIAWAYIEILQPQRRPENAKELFNLRHSSLRNAIERLYGVWKKRFPILTVAPQYNYKAQVKLVIALAVLHNFIMIAMGGRKDTLEQDFERDQKTAAATQAVRSRQRRAEGVLNSDDEESSEEDVVDDLLGRSAVMREHIAQSMWADYQNILRERELLRAG